MQTILATLLFLFLDKYIHASQPHFFLQPQVTPLLTFTQPLKTQIQPFPYTLVHTTRLYGWILIPLRDHVRRTTDCSEKQ